MRRPPDKEGLNVSERDVESSNATLNTFFGGARKKSWMIGAGAPVRPTPRASISRPGGPQASLSQRNTTTVLPSPAPSDEPSPVVPSSPGKGAGHETQRPITFGERRRLSATPARRSSGNTSPIDVAFEASTIETPAQNSTSSKRPYTQPGAPIYPSEVVEVARPMMRSPPFSNSIIFPSEHQQRFQEVPSLLNREPPQNPRPVPNVQGNVPVQPHEETNLNSAPSVQHAAQNTQWPSPFQASREVLPSPVQPSGFSPRVSPGFVVPEAQSSSNSNIPGSNPHKRQRTQQDAAPSLKSRTFLINNHVNSVGGFESLNYDLERPRFQLLERACLNEDMFYVALHQLFCIWDFNQNEVAGIVGFPSITVLRVAFKVVSQLIRDNEQLALNHKQWFAQFPAPLGVLLEASKLYSRTVAEVGIFLSRLATDWVVLSMEWTSRKYPPLVDELVGRLGLLSPILQGVVFTAARRNIAVREGEFANRMDAIFKRDQMEHQALAERCHTDRPPSIEDVQDRNQKLVAEYMRVYGQLVGQRSNSSPSVSASVTPVVPSSAQFQPRPQQQQQSSRQAIMSEPAGNWHNLSPQLQQQRAFVQPPAAASPNLSVLDRRPQSVGSQQVHPNTPSPTLLQGLTVNSPIQQGFQAMGDNVQMPQQRQHNNNAYHPASTPNSTFRQGVSQMADPSQGSPRLSSQQHQRWLTSQLPPLVRHQQQQQQQQQLALAQLELISQGQQDHQNQTMMQHQVLNQGLASLNRATSRMENSFPIVNQQRFHSRANIASPGVRHMPNTNGGFGPARQIAHAGGYRMESTLSTEKIILANAAKYNALPPLERPLAPPVGYVHQSQPTNPELTALHQAHLRSPRLVAADSASSEITQGDPGHRYYQAVKHFALQPTKINSSISLSQFTFVIPTADLDLIPGDYLRGPGQVPTREFRGGTIQYRLRCVQMKKTENTCPISEWAVHDTVWPESTCIDVNTKHLEIRRKSHHGKDLPVDITSYVRSAGPHSTIRITMSITRGRSRMKEFNYFIAVEVIEILAHAAIWSLCQQNHIPASHTLENIKKSLAGPSPEDDDDFAMVVSDLAIDLADPFTARIFETPVRGSSCLHRECFDLQTFLLTRNSKPKRPEQPCMIDVWKCPLCSKDARPYSLRIDDFLASVRASLESQNMLDVKAIWIGPDGKWRPKIEERTGTADTNDSDYSSDDEYTRKQQVANEQKQQSRSKRAIEVIDLDDD